VALSCIETVKPTTPVIAPGLRSIGSCAAVKTVSGEKGLRSPVVEYACTARKYFALGLLGSGREMTAEVVLPALKPVV
jgi:hypothetical protein